MTPSVLTRRTTRLMTARLRLPHTRAVWLSEDLNRHILAQMDWPSLMAFARTSKHCKDIVLAEVKVRIEFVLAAFIPDILFEKFWDAMAEAGAAIVGGVALYLLRLCHKTFEDELTAAEQGGYPHPSTQSSLDVLVPDAAFDSFKTYLLSTGYSVGWNIGIGLCYKQAGIRECTVMTKKPAAGVNEELNVVICIYRCSQPVLRTVMRSPWSIQTNVITANAVHSAFPRLSYEVTCLRNRRAHPLTGPGMHIPEYAFYEPYNGDWQESCGIFCPTLKRNRPTFFNGVSTYTWDTTRRTSSDRKQDAAYARTCRSPRWFGIFCYNKTCSRGEEWLLPWGGPRGCLLDSPF